VRILFLSQRVPYPPDRGDKITTWRLIQRMRRSHEVRCVAFAHDHADLDAARELERLGIPTHAIGLDLGRAKLLALPSLLGSNPLTLSVYGSRELQRRVDELAADSDLGYAYSSSMGAFLEPHARQARELQPSRRELDPLALTALAAHLTRAEVVVAALARRPRTA